MQVQAVSSKNIDALLSIEPARAIGLAKGLTKDVRPHPPMVHAIAPRFYGSCGVVRHSFKKANPKLTKKIIDIFKQASKQIKKDPVAAKKYLLKYTPLTDEVAQIVDIPLFKEVDQLDQTDIESIQAFLDIFFKHQVIKRKILVSELLLVSP